MQAATLNVRAIVLFEEIDTIGRNHQTRAVVARHELFLDEIPDRKFKVFARATD